MIQTSKTAEIMSKYRPIAPKPESSPETNGGNGDSNSNLPQSFRKSPYLRNIWAHLQARPTRTRKRGGRTPAFALAPPPIKRSKTSLQGIMSSPSPVFQLTNSSPPKASLSIHGLIGSNSNTLFSLLPINSLSLDLNMEVVEINPDLPKPKEVDFMPQLKKPVKQMSVVIAPHPVRPVGSNIFVKCINPDPDETGIKANKSEEVEKEVNEEEVPAIVSDSRNRVRLANSAYKEMVGQPECGWLDCVTAVTCGGARWRRIGGQVVLQFEEDSEVEKMNKMEAQGFNCKVKIEWEKNDGGKDKCCLDAICKGVKILECEEKDYKYLWRFYTQNQSK